MNGLCPKNPLPFPAPQVVQSDADATCLQPRDAGNASGRVAAWGRKTASGVFEPKSGPVSGADRLQLHDCIRVARTGGIKPRRVTLYRQRTRYRIRKGRLRGQVARSSDHHGPEEAVPRSSQFYRAAMNGARPFILTQDRWRQSRCGGHLPGRLAVVEFPPLREWNRGHRRDRIGMDRDAARMSAFRTSSLREEER